MKVTGCLPKTRKWLQMLRLFRKAEQACTFSLLVKSTRMASHYQHVVIGAGIEGSWTAYNLARRGRQVLLLEQFPLPHDRGSSHGQSRIIKKAHPSVHEAQFMEESYKEWRQLEKDSGLELLLNSPLLCIAASSEHEKIDQIIKTFGTFQRASYKVLTPEDLRNEYPQVVFDNKVRACVDYDAGVLKPNRCLPAVQAKFKECGGVIKDTFPVKRIEPGQPAVVHGEKESFAADSVIVCAGPWSKKLLGSLGLDVPLITWRINVPYWRLKPSSPSLGMSIIYYDGESHFYSLPELEYPDLVKIVEWHQKEADPDDRDHDCEPGEMKNLVSLVKKHFPGVEPIPAIVEYCMYTMSPDDFCILDRHPKYNNIVFGCGFSGTGFKISPAVGQILGDLACGKDPSFNIQPFSLARFS